MAANAYYAAAPPYPLDDHHEPQHQHHQPHILPWESPPQYSSSSSRHSASSSTSSLKPLHLLTAHHPQTSSHLTLPALKSAQDADIHLKSRIRHLRLLSRVLALLLSIAVFVPITLTLVIFLRTKDTYRTVVTPNGTEQSRTAWSGNSKVWPTWMYFLIAATSLILNLAIILSYFFAGVKGANRTAVVTTTFTWVVMVSHLVVWSVGVTLYRTEKDGGNKAEDLWGWSCSAAARAIQDEFKHDVHFDRVCNVQSVSWYVGIVQVLAAGLGIVIFALAVRRRKVKERVERQERFLRGYEAVR